MKVSSCIKYQLVEEKCDRASPEAIREKLCLVNSKPGGFLTVLHLNSILMEILNDVCFSTQPGFIRCRVLFLGETL